MNLKRGDPIKTTTNSSIKISSYAVPPQCPVFDLETNVEFDGIYQTMSTQTTMLLQVHYMPSFFSCSINVL